jgi:CDP-glucose 4,6-dehydratase
VAIGPRALETLVMPPDPQFWHGKRVLLTGHTGFKGAWLALWLQRLGAQVSALALPPSTQPSLFAAANLAQACDSSVCDIRDATAVAAAVRRAEPQIVLHLAAQALVRASYKAPLETFATNVMGSAHMLDALRGLDSVRAVVMVTTDKVYRHQGQPGPGQSTYPFRETDELGGHDPYSASKAACELVVASYRDAFLRAQGVAVASARAGNVIGGGDWSEDRLIPDAVRAWQAGSVLSIRHPQAIRPWQHVLEPLSAYLRLAECLWHDPTKASAYNFGPRTGEAASVGEVVSLARQAYGSGDWLSQADPHAPHEAGWLALEVAQARSVLGVLPRWPLQEAVQRTMHWYRRFAEGADARALCEADIDAFEAGR